MDSRSPIGVEDKLRGSDGFMTFYEFVNMDISRHGRIPTNILVALRTHSEFLGILDYSRHFRLLVHPI